MRIQVFLNQLYDIVRIFGIHFAPSKCRVLMQDQIGPKLNPVLGGEQLDEVDRFSYFGI